MAARSPPTPEDQKDMKYVIASFDPETREHTIGHRRFTARGAARYIRFLRIIWYNLKFRKVPIEDIPAPEPKEAETIPVRRTARYPIADGAFRTGGAGRRH